MIPQSRYFCTRQDIYWKRFKRRKIKVKIRISSLLLSTFILGIILKLKKYRINGADLTRYLEMKKFNRATNRRKQVTVQFLRSTWEIRDLLLKGGMLSGTHTLFAGSALCARDGGLETGCLENCRAKIEKIIPRIENGKNEVEWSCSPSRRRIWARNAVY